MWPAVTSTSAPAAGHHTRNRPSRTPTASSSSGTTRSAGTPGLVPTASSKPSVAGRTATLACRSRRGRYASSATTTPGRVGAARPGGASRPANRPRLRPAGDTPGLWPTTRVKAPASIAAAELAAIPRYSSSEPGAVSGPGAQVASCRASAWSSSRTG